MTAAFVQQAPGNGNGTATVACTFPGAVGADGFVVGTCQWPGATSGLLSVSDDKGNTYTIILRTRDAGNDQSAAIFYLEGINNAPTVITATFTPNFSTGITATEFSGVKTSASIDQSVAQQEASPGTGADAANSTSITPTQDNELLICGIAATGLSGDGANLFTQGTDFTEPANAEDSVSGHVQQSIEYLIQTSAAAHDGTWTLARNGAVVTMIASFFKAGPNPAVPIPSVGSFGRSGGRRVRYPL